jgi:hypothetical protein
MKFVIEIEDVRDWHACENALRLMCKTLREHHPKEYARNIGRCILGETEGEWQAKERFGDACQRFPHAELRLVLEYCAMEGRARRGWRKYLLDATGAYRRPKDMSEEE